MGLEIKEGYELDTFPFLAVAIKMYKKMGFYEIEQYF